MKVAVITPYAGESPVILQKCIQSVGHQQGVEITHFLVSDGVPIPAGYGADVVPILLDIRANDGGATPRTIGCQAALSRGVDAIAFLDADNEYYPEHLATCLSLNVPIATSLRELCKDGEPFAVDRIDSDGTVFADPNTIVLRGTALDFGRMWNWRDRDSPFQASTGRDRVFWERLKRSFPKAAHANTGLATVRYNTRWICHYNHVGAPAPPGRVCTMAQRKDGVMVKLWGKPRKEHPTNGGAGDREFWQIHVDPVDDDPLGFRPAQ